MLKRNPEERATLSEILQDSELRKALENPLDGMVIANSGEVVVLFQVLFSTFHRALVRHLREDDIITCLDEPSVLDDLIVFSLSLSLSLPVIYPPLPPSLLILLSLCMLISFCYNESLSQKLSLDPRTMVPIQGRSHPG